VDADEVRTDAVVAFLAFQGWHVDTCFVDGEVSHG
jgi:hypothetical protein